MNNIKNSNESIKIKNIIKDAEDKKSLLLIDMGSLTYQKIRENIIIDKDFDTICTEILELDKIIYNNNKELENEFKNRLKEKKLPYSQANWTIGDNPVDKSLGKEVKKRYEFTSETPFQDLMRDKEGAKIVDM